MFSNKIKKITLLPALLVGSLFLVSTSVFAGEWTSEGRGNKEKWEQRSEKMYQKLNVTPEQKALLKAQKEKYRSEMKNIHEQMEGKRKAIHEQLEKPDFDEQSVRATHNELKSLHNEMEDARLSGILEVRKILTPDQFKQLGEERRNGFKHRRGQWNEKKTEDKE